MHYSFGAFELNTDRFELRRDGEVVPVEPQVFGVLAYLIEHRDRVVSKYDLLDNVWGDRFVGESALTSRIKAARRAVGDDGRGQQVIRTLHGRGYRFVAPLVASHTAGAVRAGGDVPAPAVTTHWPIVGRNDELELLRPVLR